jgi:hypothetical protein
VATTLSPAHHRSSPGQLVGREDVRAELYRVLAETASGHGGLMLLGGEAGVGKTSLAASVLHESHLLVLGVTAGAVTAAPFGPVVAALRAYVRVEPDGLPLDDPLGRYLPLLLPELGPRPQDVDRATLFEVVRAAFTALAQRQPTVVFIDDLHEADHATLELLPYLAAAARELSLLLLGTYRSDELRRDHPLRRLRAELRRASALREVLVEPLNAESTAALAEHILGRPASAELAAILRERSDGLPLFIEELLAALLAGDRLEERHGTWHLADRAALLPVPDTIRDLVLLRATRLSDEARAALEVAAVAGTRFDLDLVVSLAGDDPLGEGFAHGLLIETDPGAAAFRHALVREALYRDIPWPRRRALHRQLPNSCSGKAPRRVSWPSTGSPDASRNARAWHCSTRPPPPARCTRTATPPSSRSERSSCGQRASSSTSGWPRSISTRSARRSAVICRALPPHGEKSPKRIVGRGSSLSTPK